jgi:prophage tail gpP-like protein
MREVTLTVNGREYGGWKDIRVTRSLESLSGSFAMSVSEKWNGQRDPWPLLEGDQCVLKLGDEAIITGYVDSRSMRLSADDHSFSVSGRDRSADLVDCSAVLEAWEFNGVSVLQIAQRVAKPFGIQVSVQSGVALPKTPRRLVINPGESAFDVIDRACRLAGLFAISDGTGNVVLTRAGAATAATPLMEGQNILEASADFDDSGRYYRYLVIAQQQGDDETNGEDASEVQAEAFDPNVTRRSRVLMLRAEGSASLEQAQQRANWEATVRHARANVATVKVQGWEQANGDLWPVNALVNIAASFLGVRKQMLISEATYVLSQGEGTTTELTLRPPNAFLPEPLLENDGTWKEIAGGA